MKTKYEWLQSANITQDVFLTEKVSWSSYHSKNGRDPHVEVCPNVDHHITTSLVTRSLFRQ
jgi:hypothetical protein